MLEDITVFFRIIGTIFLCIGYIREDLVEITFWGITLILLAL